MITSLLAWVGALLSCLLCLPQAYRTVRADRLTGVAAGTYWLTLGNAAVWAAWALATGQPAVALPALVNGPACVLILLRLRRSSTAGPATAGEPTPRPGTDVRRHNQTCRSCARSVTMPEPMNQSREVAV